MNDFCVFILSHGRAENIKTLKALKKCGYTGEWIIIIDDADEQKELYFDKYGDRVRVFSKKEIAKTFDTGDNFKDNKTIVYARNACFEIARETGYKYFIQLDDDYTHFSFKFDRQFVYRDRKIKNLDKVFEIMLNFYKSVDCLSLAMAQNGDFIGGKKGGFGKSIRLRRKCMNSFICSTDRPFKFIGRINEDVNTYTNLGSRSKPFFTINNVSLNQTNTQKNKGGMTETYLDSGTYVKSFYSVMYSPSSVKIAEMGDKHRRIHHRVDWEVAVPKIIREDI